SARFFSFLDCCPRSGHTGLLQREVTPACPAASLSTSNPTSWGNVPPVHLRCRSTESQEIQSRVLARVRLSPDCPLRAEKHSPAGEGPEDSPWERSHVVPTRGLGDAEPPARRAVGSDRCDRCRRPGG
ncbi:hypothetical protein E2I00_015001, partial [Balaenoptera physalus]